MAHPSSSRCIARDPRVGSQYLIIRPISREGRDPHAFASPPDHPDNRRLRALRPPLWRLRPRPGPHRGRVLKGILGKYAANDDPAFRTRAILIKEQRAELVKHHLWVLWTDYFKPPHFEKYPELHGLFNEATKLAGASGAKGSVDPATADELLAKIAEIDKIFWETKAA